MQDIRKPSDIFKDALKSNISSHKEHFAIIIRYDIRKKSNTYAKSVMEYRRQIEIVSLILCLVENKDSKLFKSVSAINDENHWKAEVILDDKNMEYMLSSTYANLQKSKKKIEDINLREISYSEYAPPVLNLGLNHNSPKCPSAPVVHMFAENKDYKYICDYYENLDRIYEDNIAKSNKQI